MKILIFTANFIEFFNARFYRIVPKEKSVIVPVYLSIPFMMVKFYWFNVAKVNRVIATVRHSSNKKWN